MDLRNGSEQTWLPHRFEECIYAAEKSLQTLKRSNFLRSRLRRSRCLDNGDVFDREERQKTILREPMHLARFQFLLHSTLLPRHGVFWETTRATQGQISFARAIGVYRWSNISDKLNKSNSKLLSTIFLGVNRVCLGESLQLSKFPRPKFSSLAPSALAISTRTDYYLRHGFQRKLFTLWICRPSLPYRLNLKPHRPLTHPRGALEK